ncbi:MAG: ABC transporter permease, partial [Bacteroidetes bacterium]|nr:ABC transporter permease [Bacteroidota bacterium]
MIKNYIRTAVRAFLKNKVTTCINLLGLSIGISAALIIFMLVEYDHSFDRWEPGCDRIYRIVSESDVFKNSGAPVPLLEAVRRSTAGVEKAALILECSYGRAKVTVPQAKGKVPVIYKAQEQIVFADSNYFSLFPHEWMAGSPAVSLREPRRLVLTESRARLYFPGIPVSQVVGRTVVFCDTIITTVGGVVKDLRSNSDFEVAGVISLSTVASGGLAASYNWNEWGAISSNTTEFVKLAPGVGVRGIDKQIAAISDLHRGDEDRKQVHRLQALSDIHTNLGFNGRVNEQTVRNLIWLAVFLLLLGAINFINLSTAHAAERGKEIGIRKTLGGQRAQLILQFLTETFVLTAATAVVSVLISPLLLRAVSGFIPEGLKVDRFLMQPLVWGFLFLLVVMVSIIAGLYPAFVLSGFRPVSVLKGGVAAGGTRGAWLRKVLIVLQFAVAQVFIVAVFVVDRQIHYSVEKDMGFKKDAIVNFNVPFDFEHPNGKKYVLRDEIARIPGIERVSLGSQSPAFGGRMSSRLRFKEKKQDLNFDVDARWGDTSFLSVYGLQLVAGRNIGYSDTANEVLV